MLILVRLRKLQGCYKYKGGCQGNLGWYDVKGDKGDRHRRWVRAGVRDGSGRPDELRARAGGPGPGLGTGRSGAGDDPKKNKTR